MDENTQMGTSNQMLNNPSYAAYDGPNEEP